MSPQGCTSNADIKGGKCPLRPDGACPKDLKCPLMNANPDTAASGTGLEGAIWNRPTCKFNNMPCMRGCQGTACALYADWSKAQGPRDRAILDTQQTMRMASAAASIRRNPDYMV